MSTGIATDYHARIISHVNDATAHVDDAFSELAALVKHEAISSNPVKFSHREATELRILGQDLMQRLSSVANAISELSE
jgi:hypothetical protein